MTQSNNVGLNRENSWTELTQERFVEEQTRNRLRSSFLKSASLGRLIDHRFCKIDAAGVVFNSRIVDNVKDTLVYSLQCASNSCG